MVGYRDFPNWRSDISGASFVPLIEVQRALGGFSDGVWRNEVLIL